MEERMRFVMQCQQQEESMAQLCRLYGISRRVGYKWLARYRELGVEGVREQSKAPHLHPNQLSAGMHQRIVQLRGQHPRWGPRKLRVLLERQQVRAEDEAIPAASTIGQILRREGLSVPRRRVRH